MVRAETALALVRVKPNAVEAVEPLTALLEDSAPDVIVNAGIALGTIGEAAQSAIDLLKRLQDHSDDRVAQVAGGGDLRTSVQRYELMPTGIRAIR